MFALCTKYCLCLIFCSPFVVENTKESLKYGIDDDDIKQWTGDDYLQLKNMATNRGYWRRRMSLISVRVENNDVISY